jgi:hypothetical protein
MSTPDETWQTGRLQHVEFWASGLSAMRARLKGAGIPFTERTLPDKQQVNVRDPNGIAIGMNFPLTDT